MLLLSYFFVDVGGGELRYCFKYLTLSCCRNPRSWPTTCNLSVSPLRRRSSLFPSGLSNTSSASILIVVCAPTMSYDEILSRSIDNTGDTRNWQLTILGFDCYDTFTVWPDDLIEHLNLWGSPSKLACDRWIPKVAIGCVVSFQFSCLDPFPHHTNSISIPRDLLKWYVEDVLRLDGEKTTKIQESCTWYTCRNEAGKESEIPLYLWFKTTRRTNMRNDDTIMHRWTNVRLRGTNYIYHCLEIYTEQHFCDAHHRRRNKIDTKNTSSTCISRTC